MQHQPLSVSSRYIEAVERTVRSKSIEIRLKIFYYRMKKKEVSSCRSLGFTHSSFKYCPTGKLASSFPSTFLHLNFLATHSHLPLVDKHSYACSFSIFMPCHRLSPQPLVYFPVLMLSILQYTNRIPLPRARRSPSPSLPLLHPFPTPLCACICAYMAPFRSERDVQATVRSLFLFG